MVRLDPSDIERTGELRRWFDSEGKSMDLPDLSNSTDATHRGGLTSEWELITLALALSVHYKTLVQIAAEGLGLGDRPDYINVKAMCVSIRKDTAVYTVNVTRRLASLYSSVQMCPEENCGKKVVDENNGTFRCEKCCKVYGYFKWAYMLSVEIADATSSQWINVFGNEAEALLGITADALGNHRVNVGVAERLVHIRRTCISLQKNDSAIDSIVRRATHRERLFKLRAKAEQFNVRDPNDNQASLLTLPSI